MIPPPDPLESADYTALADFRYGMRKFLRFSKEFLATEARLTPEQYEALLALKVCGDKNGIPVGVLSERLQVKHHTAVALSDKLVSRKLATKRRGQTDRREVYVKLTRVGVQLLDKMATVHRDAIRRYVGEMIQALTHLQNS